MRGREMDGWLRIDIDAHATDDELKEWGQARCRLRQVAAAEVIESENSQSGILVMGLTVVTNAPHHGVHQPFHTMAESSI